MIQAKFMPHLTISSLHKIVMVRGLKIKKLVCRVRESYAFLDFDDQIAGSFRV